VGGYKWDCGRITVKIKYNTEQIGGSVLTHLFLQSEPEAEGMKHYDVGAYTIVEFPKNRVFDMEALIKKNPRLNKAVTVEEA
jgi:hypothetical protein